VPQLTINIPIGLRFRNNPGTITNQSIVQDANNNLVGLQVQPGNSLALVGGNINLSDGGRLTATGGSIELGGLAAEGTVGLDITGNSFKLNFPTNILLSDITLSNARVQNILFSGTTGTAGDVNVTANNLSLINGGQISASTFGTGDAGRVVINATGNISVSGENTNQDFVNYGAIASLVNENAEGNSGGIQIITNNLSLTDGAVIDASTFGKGDAGSVIINATGNISVSGEDKNGFGSGIFSSVNENAEGNSGGIQISTKDLSLTNGGQISASTYGQGNAGSVIINATGNISASGEDSNGSNSGIFSGVYSTEKGDAGGIEINTKDISLTNGGQIDASTFGKGNAGSVIINATGNISASGESIQKEFNSGIFSGVNSTAQGDAGGIEIKTNNLSLTDGGRISASTSGNGNAGSVIINATGNISASGESKEGSLSGIFSQVNSTGQGDAGGIEISTKDLSLTDGAQISASTLGKGNAGRVIINATGNISASGESNEGFPSGIFSGVYSTGQGDAGGIEINTKDISLTNGGQIDASTFGKGNAGSVIINATGNISASGESIKKGFNSGIFSEVYSTEKGDAGGIEINTKDISLINGGQISASTDGQGNAGSVIINATGNISASGKSQNYYSGIFSTVGSSGAGNAGGIEINTKDLSLTDGGRISASTLGKGNAARIIINVTGNISASGEANNGIGSGIFSAVAQNAEGSSDGIQISTKDLSLTDGGIINASTLGNGNAGSVIINATGTISASGEKKDGDRSGIFSQVESNAEGSSDGIQINTKDLSLTNGGQISASTLGKGNAGRVIINATGNISADGESQQLGYYSGIFSIVNSTAQGDAGGIEIKTNNLSLTDGALINASTLGKGNAGRIIINATDNIFVSGEAKNGNRSGIFSQVDQQDAEGSSDGIEINTKDLSLTNGGQISASTLGKGNAGRVIINATGNISADGESQQLGYYSGIFSIVNSTAQGDAGGIEIKTNNLSLTDGGRISASTLGQGNAGSVIINATGNISAEGESKDGTNSGIYSGVAPSGIGNAGGIKINARSLSLSNGATLTTDSQGNGAAGNIEVTTAKDIRLDNRASITANTTGGQGNIILNSRDLILRRNSIIQTDATGTVQGGNITIITGNFVALGNSDITANAEKGFGGNIFIKAAYRFSSQDSDITATSDLGTQFGGTVRINTTDVNPSEGLVQLPNNLTDPGDQIAQNPCQKGTGSVFIITGRGGLPSSPNENFSSDNVRVDLAQPVSSSSSQTATINQPKTPATAQQIIPAQGWIFNEKGEVVLTAYDVTSRDFQRPQQNSAACRAF
jgi:large exoprotein involved in heme utilization and adhesion